MKHSFTTDTHTGSGKIVISDHSQSDLFRFLTVEREDMFKRSDG